MNEFDSVVRNIKKVVDLNDEELLLLKQRLKIRLVKKHRLIVRQGEICKSTFYINKGSIRTYFNDINGQQHIVQFGIEDWWCSDLKSFITQKPAQLNVEAIEDTELFELPYESLQDLYKRLPKLERFFRLLIQNALIAFQNRMLQNLSMDAESRYVAFAEEYPLMNRRIQQKYIASYLGMSAEFLSKKKAYQ